LQFEGLQNITQETTLSQDQEFKIEIFNK